MGVVVMTDKRVRKLSGAAVRREDANRERVEFRLREDLYDEVRRWAEEDDVTFSHEARALLLLGKMVADNPALLAQLVRDPRAQRTSIVRGLGSTRAQSELPMGS